MRKRSRFELAEFSRGQSDLVWTDGGKVLPIELSGLPAWQSNGGPTRSHPARALPFSLSVALPESQDRLIQVSLIGVFAMWGDAEGAGSTGAYITIGDEKSPLVRLDLLNRRHYDAAEDLDRTKTLGDGTSVRPVGKVEIGGKTYRVDELSIDVPPGPTPSKLHFRDMATAASFVIFDIVLEYEPKEGGCPFHSSGGGVSLEGIPGIIRAGDRVRFSKALDQLQKGLETSKDLDEARGEALMFIAIISAAMLEMGGARSMHRILLQAARDVDEIADLAEIGRRAKKIVEDLVSPSMNPPSSHSSLIDAAINIVNRNYAKDLTDEIVAEQLNLSRSHFRFLFHKETKISFHKYLIGVRLEQARSYIVETDLPISLISTRVGFSSVSHFSRAFKERFDVSPSDLRRGVN